MLVPILTTALLVAHQVHCSPAGFRPDPFASALRQRQTTSGDSSSTQVDLGYEVYNASTNSTTKLNIWRGIRYAAPPTGPYRWQAPQTPASNRSSVIQAHAFAPICPQNNDAPVTLANDTLASEDCLFLNVYSPSNATGPLPVLIWIHGGGYGEGNGTQDLTSLINANGNSFLGVAIQYRLGAFGFLSSDEVFRNGVVNAGLLDQHFALQWVQSYISLFNGNASHVTIAGESAGGGSVMLQDMAYGGTRGDSLFTNTIAASPYLPMQYGYKDWVPSQSYYAFASAVGCPDVSAYGHVQQTIFQCLVSKDTETLQKASAHVSGSGKYGTYGFLPVTDGLFLQQLPSQQLLLKQVNGKNLLIGNNADEGVIFTPQNITTEAELVSWLQLTFPLFTNDDISKILLYYPSTNASVNPNAAEFPTLGYAGPTAINQSDIGSGQEQRADNIYAETTFVCPSYWMAEAYSDKGRTSYKYQYSVSIALHGTDTTAYFGTPTPNQGPDFELAFQTIWGNFITRSNPSISNEIANGVSSSSTTANPASSWPPFTIYAPYQLDLNETGGTRHLIPIGEGVSAPEQTEPGLKNNFSLVNAYTWEGGRGYRCDFWRSMGLIVPE